MRVWVVYGGEYEQWFLGGVFSSLEKSEAFCAKGKRGGYSVYSDEGYVIDEEDTPYQVEEKNP